MSTHLSEFDLAPMSFVVRHLRRVRSVSCVFQSRDTDIIGVLVSQRACRLTWRRCRRHRRAASSGGATSRYRPVSSQVRSAIGAVRSAVEDVCHSGSNVKSSPVSVATERPGAEVLWRR